MDNPCRHCIAPKRRPGCQSTCEQGIIFKEYKQAENDYNKSLTISFVSDHEHAKRRKAIQDSKDDKLLLPLCDAIRLGIQALQKIDNVKTCSACGAPCTDEPEEQYECREVVFKDSKMVICSDCSIDYEENGKGEVVLRNPEQEGAPMPLSDHEKVKEMLKVYPAKPDSGLLVDDGEDANYTVNDGLEWQR